MQTAHPSAVSKSRGYFSRKLKELYQQMIPFYKQASIPSNALLASYKIAHIGQLILLAAEDMVNLMIGESAGFSALALMKSKYRSKNNVEEEISSLDPRFEKMCGDQQAHPSHK